MVLNIWRSIVGWQKNIPTEHAREEIINSDKNHKEQVQHYASKYGKKNLFIDVTKCNDQSKQLHDFLGFTQPIKKFPHSNKT